MSGLLEDLSDQIGMIREIGFALSLRHQPDEMRQGRRYVRFDPQRPTDQLFLFLKKLIFPRMLLGVHQEDHPLALMFDEIVDQTKHKLRRHGRALQIVKDQRLRQRLHQAFFDNIARERADISHLGEFSEGIAKPRAIFKHTAAQLAFQQGASKSRRIRHTVQRGITDGRIGFHSADLRNEMRFPAAPRRINQDRVSGRAHCQITLKRPPRCHIQIHSENPLKP